MMAIFKNKSGLINDLHYLSINALLYARLSINVVYTFCKFATEPDFVQLTWGREGRKRSDLLKKRVTKTVAKLVMRSVEEVIPFLIPGVDASYY